MGGSAQGDLLQTLRLFTGRHSHGLGLVCDSAARSGFCLLALLPQLSLGVASRRRPRGLLRGLLLLSLSRFDPSRVIVAGSHRSQVVRRTE